MGGVAGKDNELVLGGKVGKYLGGPPLSLRVQIHEGIIQDQETLFF